MVYIGGCKHFQRENIKASWIIRFLLQLLQFRSSCHIKTDIDDMERMNETSVNISHVGSVSSVLCLNFILERWRRKEIWGRFVVHLIYSFTDWFWCVPWPGIKPATLMYQDNILTNWATWPVFLSQNFYSLFSSLFALPNSVSAYLICHLNNQLFNLLI